MRTPWRSHQYVIISTATLRVCVISQCAIHEETMIPFDIASIMAGLVSPCCQLGREHTRRRLPMDDCWQIDLNSFSFKKEQTSTAPKTGKSPTLHQCSVVTVTILLACLQRLFLVAFKLGCPLRCFSTTIYEQQSNSLLCDCTAPTSRPKAVETNYNGNCYEANTSARARARGFICKSSCRADQAQAWGVSNSRLE